MKLTFHRMLWILALSGACSLVYQVTWSRMLRSIFGAGQASSAAVLAIFMGGLGLGGWFFGRHSRHAPRPLMSYANVELAITLGAALSPLALIPARAIYLATGGVFALGLGPATVLRLLLAILVIGLPAFFMGGTLPLAAQALERRRDLSRRRIAWLYGVNTLGAVAGAALTNFFLLEQLGIRGTLWPAAAVNGGLAGLAMLMARSLDRESAAAADPGRGSKEARAEDPIGAEQTAGPRAKRLPAVAAAVGFAFFLMEMIWYRMMASVLGGSTYTLGLILAVALLGIAIGGLLYALGKADRRPTRLDLAWTCVLEGALLGIPLMMGDSLALFAGHLRHLSTLGFHGLIFSWVLVLSVVILPAAVVAGYQFPLLVALLGQGRHNAGRDVGRAYAWNTAGAIAGALAGGFGLIPWLGAVRLWRWTVFFLVLVGFALLLPKPRGGFAGRRAPGVLMLGLVACLGVALAEGPTAFWRHEPIGAGRLSTELKTPNQLERHLRSKRWAIISATDGVESSIGVEAHSDVALLVNGKSDGAALGDASTTVMSGLIGAALHPEPRRALVIGLGVGTTAGWFAQLPDMESVDVVELEPAVVAAGALLSPLAFHWRDSPKIRLHIGDGRELIHTRDETWDLIFSEPSNPYRAGVGDLFSADFYLQARKRLAPNGLFLQWLQGYDADPEILQTVFATIRSQFPVVETWQVGPTDLLLVASEEPVSHPPPHLQSRLAEPAYADGMRSVWGVSGSAGLYSGFVAGPGLADLLLPAGKISTDDHPLVEMGFARTTGRGHHLPIPRLRDLARRTGRHRPPGLPEEIWQTSRDLLQMRVYQGSADGDLADGPLTEWDSARLAFSQNRPLALRQLAPTPAGSTSAHWDRLVLATLQIETEDEAAPTTLRLIAENNPAEALLLQARLYLRQGRHQEAGSALVSVFESLRRDPWISQDLTAQLPELVNGVATADTQLADALYSALEPPFAGHILRYSRLLMRNSLLDASPRFAERCVDFFAPLEPEPLWVRPLLESRYRCYRANRHPLGPNALDDLRAYLDQAEPDFTLPAAE